MKCKFCNSENLILEKRSKDNKHILDAQQVALICGDCGKYIKWCPKDERKFYWVKMKIPKNNLEEENRVLKKALELACEELETRDEGKTHARLFIQKIKNNYLGDNVGYEEYFIQQAKESEKDEEV